MSSENVPVRFKWIKKSKTRLTTISTSPHTAIIDALKTSDTFRKYHKKEAHSLIIHGNKIRAQINPLAPCGALRKDEELELRDSKSSKQKALETTSYPSCIGGVFIKVNKKGRTLGGQSKIILHNKESSKDGIPLAVFGYKKETVEKALLNDKRFDVFGSFKLEGTKGETYDSHVQLAQLPDDMYTVIVPQTNRDNSSNPQEPNKSSNPPNNDLNQFVPTEAMKKTAETLSENFRAYVKYHGGLRKAWRFMKKMYCNNMKESRLSTHTHRMLVQRADSVGCIVSTQSGNREALGTGFLLNGCVGLTCHHVVENLLNTNDLAIIFKYDREGQSLQEIQFVLQIEIIFHNKDADFAFFRIPPHLNWPGGLLKHVVIPPVNGRVSIIGHPCGQYQQIDPECSVINLYDRVDEIKDKIANDPAFLNILSQYNFLEMANPRLLTYNTCFYFGSSGSPVFNDSGELVAMHQGGYAVKNLRKTESPIEFGRNIVDIVICGALEIEDLRLQFKNVVEQNESLREYIKSGQHPTRMQPIIRQLLQLWEINDSGVGGDSDMEMS
ncbi:PREDICTED: protein FAM111A-like [Nanorana parkeri]|uniref:protein FAM111A-like n=1 Tax=Nanorana parkeri TaxID=125878 RepID=UPI0008549C38|nr:PREDICTED: protein FAM111A-like [Nanorana parkeri]